MLSFQEKRQLQKVILEQNRILAGPLAPKERDEAKRIKLEAMEKLGIAPKPNLESE